MSWRTVTLIKLRLDLRNLLHEFFETLKYIFNDHENLINSSFHRAHNSEFIKTSIGSYLSLPIAQSTASPIPQRSIHLCSATVEEETKTRSVVPAPNEMEEPRRTACSRAQRCPHPSFPRRPFPRWRRSRSKAGRESRPSLPVQGLRGEQRRPRAGSERVPLGDTVAGAIFASPDTPPITRRTLPREDPRHASTRGQTADKSLAGRSEPLANRFIFLASCLSGRVGTAGRIIGAKQDLLRIETSPGVCGQRASDRLRRLSGRSRGFFDGTWISYRATRTAPRKLLHASNLAAGGSRTGTGEKDTSDSESDDRRSDVQHLLPRRASSLVQLLRPSPTSFRVTYSSPGAVFDFQISISRKSTDFIVALGRVI